MEKYLARLPEGVAGTTPAAASKAAAAATFLGGESFIRTTGNGLAHVAVGLPAPAAGSKQAYALGVLTALLGSTPKRSALRFGPAGQSRIARSVHNEAHSFIHSLSAFALPYADTGIVGLSGTCADHETGRLVDAMAGFLKDAAAVATTAGELDRAKRVYKVALAAAAEGRDTGRDALGAELAVLGKATPLAEKLAAVDSVSAADIQAVAKAALASGRPAISAIGSLETIPRYDVLTGIFKA